jgi:type IX secretion system PorP/SprF family membrane protein
MILAKRLLFLLIVFVLLTPLKSINGQQLPLRPVSYRIFTPLILNPAIVGSKDFGSLDLIASWQGKNATEGKYVSQILSGSTRLSKKAPGSFFTPKYKNFINIGLGGYLFNEESYKSRNMGASLSFSYQLPLNKNLLSFLSFGASIKGLYSKKDSIASADPLLMQEVRHLFYPNIDFGIYYYGPNMFAGISATNLLGNPESPDSLGVFYFPVTRQYYFLAGYKILISRRLNIVIEPSVILNLNEDESQKLTDFIKPMIKIYLQDFCIGSYFHDNDKISLFFQYKYPRFYIGTYLELPKDRPYFKTELNFELAIGISFSEKKSKYNKYYHW